MSVRVGGWDVNDTTVLNRELSWLAFNGRVLELAADLKVPLLERVRYLSIYAGNLDEFFQVRVSGLHDQIAAGISAAGPDGRTPRRQIEDIRSVVLELGARQEKIFATQVLPALNEMNIELLEFDDLTSGEQDTITERFRRRIFPILTPLAVDPGHPFPYISDLSLNLAVVVRNPADREKRFARVKVPNTLERWISLDRGLRFVSLESVLATHLDQLFPGMDIVESAPFRVTRNADLTLGEEAEDLLAAVEIELRRRRFGRAVRLEVASSMSQQTLELLIRELDLEPADVYSSSVPLDATSLNAVADLDFGRQKWPHWRGITEPGLTSENEPSNLFDVVAHRDVLLHHPYSSFSRSVVQFVRQASRDRSVLAIKLTLYRTSGDSPIIDALIEAAERGKQVAVLIEVKARFDEEANIGWARRLEQAGVHVAYGIVGLKIHSKIAMVVREEADGIRRYCHVGTGNYNHRTARLYEDIGLLTSDPVVGDDLADLFNYLTGYSRARDYERILVAPEMLRPRLYELIDSEIASGQGRMILKMNSLVDTEMIGKLYEASDAGVEIDLVIRGVCCLRPGVAGMSENIRARSIVGRYLEHSRIFHFANGGSANGGSANGGSADGGGAGGGGNRRSRTYIGSADLMRRNLDRRVEVLLEIGNQDLENRLLEVLEANLADDCLAWSLDGSGVWTRENGTVGVDVHETLQELARVRSRG
ncbi:MAG: polyphosphate kinase 1 [Acidimicrobiaceae bacterium]|nr:polyphosphate kinase 1 [Acidimicrobiaceae bacterium]